MSSMYEEKTRYTYRVVLVKGPYRHVMIRFECSMCDMPCYKFLSRSCLLFICQCYYNLFSSFVNFHRRFFSSHHLFDKVVLYVHM